jgi:hypothetical protein
MSPEKVGDYGLNLFAQKPLLPAGKPAHAFREQDPPAPVELGHEKIVLPRGRFPKESSTRS